MRSILALITLLISYGSLYPFEFRAGDASWEELLSFFHNFSLSASRGDIIGNLLLFFPFGFVAVLIAEHSSRNRTFTLAVTVAFGLMLAVLLQVAQMWIPGRVAAMGDAVINLVGLVLGVMTAAITCRLQLVRAVPIGRSTVLIPILLALLWVAYRWFPLVPTLDLQNIKNAFKPLLVTTNLDPTRILSNTAGWLAWLLILLRTGIRSITPRRLTAAAVLIVLLQPLFVFNTISTNNVIGLAIALMLLPAARHHEAVTSVCILLFISLLVAGLHPYTLARPPNDFDWLPFAGYLGGSMETNALNLLEKSFLYGALIHLMHENGARWRGAGAMAAIWLGTIEALQIWVASRTPEITDPILALLIAYAMSRVDTWQSKSVGGMQNAFISRQQTEGESQ